MFDLQLLPRIEMPPSSFDKDGNKVYHTPEGDFFSVTTIIKHALGTKAIDNWRERIGDTRATEVSTQATNRGKAIHHIAEAFLLGGKLPIDPVNMLNFNRLKPILRESISTVYGIELPLYSRVLRAGGMADLIAKWNGINSIIDYKTALRPKQEKWIEHYYLQATAYSLMMEERYGMNCPQIVVCIMVDGNEPQIFIRQRKDFFKKVLEVFKVKKDH